VLLLRFFDRVGKGIRSAPRDALIADVADPARRGRAYGLHRSMDHAGAVAGPLVAALLLGWLHLPVRQVFLAAAVPAVIVLAIILVGVREPPVHRAPEAPPGRKGRWIDLGPEFKLLLVAVLFFTFGRPTDVFLVKRVTDVGISAPVVAMLWAALHLVKMTATWYGGRLVDHAGGRRSMVGGWVLHAALFGGLALVEQPETVIALFLAYGLVYGLVEPAERAWVAQLVPADLRGTAFGYYQGIVGAASLPAGLCFGWVWGEFGFASAFLLGAGLPLSIDFGSVGRSL
jgi:MFS family permease